MSQTYLQHVGMRRPRKKRRRISSGFTLLFSHFSLIALSQTRTKTSKKTQHCQHSSKPNQTSCLLLLLSSVQGSFKTFYSSLRTLRSHPLSPLVAHLELICLSVRRTTAAHVKTSGRATSRTQRRRRWMATLKGVCVYVEVVVGLVIFRLGYRELWLQSHQFQ